MKNILIRLSERMRDHLLVQKKQSTNANNVCMYRGPCGLKCAVGALIHDDFYDNDIEGLIVRGAIVVQNAVISSLEKEGNVIDKEDKFFSQIFPNILSSWQCYHDTTYQTWIALNFQENASPSEFHEGMLKRIQSVYK